jgi:hypothetical protein
LTVLFGGDWKLLKNCFQPGTRDTSTAATSPP